MGGSTESAIKVAASRKKRRLDMLKFATRPSALARWQTKWVMDALEEAWSGLTCEEHIITTQGDRILDRPLPEIGGKGLFTQELEAELVSGNLDIAVHSLKDLPVEDPPRLVIGAVPVRAEVRDALVSAGDYTVQSLPEGAVVGTSSLRRGAQLLILRPDLRIQPLRGNVDTRVRKAQEGQYDAIVLAGAGITRLGLEEYVTEWLPLSWMLPAPGQGALAVQCRADDEATKELLSSIDDSPSRIATAAERSFLEGLGGGCSLPVGAHAIVEGENVHLRGIAASPDGTRVVRVDATGGDPREVGLRAAREALSEGAGEFLHA